MAEHTTIAAEFASAVAHPVRIRLVAALADGPRTLDSIASELDASDATILSHASALEKLEVVQSEDHEDGTRTYELRREAILYDSAWGSLPLPSKRAAAAAALTKMSAAATAAVDRGGFDREDIHLSRTTVRVDEARWREMSNLLAVALHNLGDIAEAPEPDGSTGETFQATAVMMLFSAEQTEIHVPARARVHEDDALKRMWELSEELDDVAIGAATDWDRIHGIAEELRLIARSMKEDREAPAELGHR